MKSKHNSNASLSYSSETIIKKSIEKQKFLLTKTIKQKYNFGSVFNKTTQ